MAMTHSLADMKSSHKEHHQQHARHNKGLAQCHIGRKKGTHNFTKPSALTMNATRKPPMPHTAAATGAQSHKTATARAHSHPVTHRATFFLPAHNTKHRQSTCVPKHVPRNKPQSPPHKTTPDSKMCCRPVQPHQHPPLPPIPPVAQALRLQPYHKGLCQHRLFLLCHDLSSDAVSSGEEPTDRAVCKGVKASKVHSTQPTAPPSSTWRIQLARSPCWRCLSA